VRVMLLFGSLVWKAEAPTMIGAGSLVATTAGEGPITATVILAGEGPITDTETPAGRCFAPGFK